MKTTTNQIIPSFSSRRKSQFIGLAICIMFFSPSFWKGAGGEVHANAVSISAVGMGAVAGTLTFTITWANSWNVTQTPFNNDAVWVFVKYAACVSGVPPVWMHGALSNITTDHSTSNANLLVQAVNDGMGVFVRRGLTNYGLPATIGPYNVTLKLNIVGASTYNFKVFGVEMVNINMGNFYIGDGASTSAFTSRLVTSADETSANIGAGALYGGSPAVPAAYPVGYNGMYCMKYEISQQQYVDFLNTLTYDQQTARTAYPPNGAAPATGTDAYAMIATGTGPVARNGIRLQAPGVSNTQPAVYMNDLNGDRVGTLTAASTDGLNIACNFLSWGDLAAYLDWAALRPMSEMEYEKVCRGNNTAVAREYAWGLGIANAGTNTGTCMGTAAFYGYSAVAPAGCANAVCYPCIAPVTDATLLAGTSGMNTEVANATLPGYDGLTAGTVGVGVACVGGTGPLRVGFGAKAGTLSRAQAGASYYGVMDLSGNVLEHIISTDANGITFRGDSLGNGALDATGNSNVGFWPTAAAALGTGFRGGSFLTTTTEFFGGAASSRDFYIWCGTSVAGGISRPTQTTGLTGYMRLRVSDRNNAATVDVTRVSDYGGRGVR